MGRSRHSVEVSGALSHDLHPARLLPGFHLQEIAVAEMLQQKLDNFQLSPVLREYFDETTRWRYPRARGCADQMDVIATFLDWIGQAELRSRAPGTAFPSGAWERGKKADRSARSEGSVFCRWKQPRHPLDNQRHLRQDTLDAEE